MGSIGLTTIDGDNAGNYGWTWKPEGATIMGHSAYIGLPYFKIYEWYNKIFYEKIIKE